MRLRCGHREITLIISFMQFSAHGNNCRMQCCSKFKTKLKRILHFSKLTKNFFLFSRNSHDFCLL